jgi:hypothetical protein
MKMRAIWTISMILAILAPFQGAAATQEGFFAPCETDPVLTRLFTPVHPRLGRYEACSSGQPVAALAPRGWTIAGRSPLDAFGGVSIFFDRSKLTRLYGGRRANVARGWQLDGSRFESVILVSPYPDPTLTRLEPGTLVIRFLLDQAVVR